MKLYLEVLQRIIDLPTHDPDELRHILDDLGLEVKGIEGDGAKVIFNIETLANRGDHLYALGIAREFSARYLSQLKIPPMVSSFPDKVPSVPVRLLTPKCPRYALLEMQLPERMRMRPEVASVMGESERHPIVDTLNYILLEMGQPMHAFDKDRIEGEIRVELSEAEEEIEGLDGKKYKVPSGSVMIKDKKKTVAVGGIIGCANSMVTPGTTRVLLESASFDPVSVRLTARGMGISTDASYLYERGCDGETPQTALKRLAHLVEATPGVSTSTGAHLLGFSFTETQPVEKRQILLRLSTLRKEFTLPRLGEAEVAARLKCLGYGVKQNEKEFMVSVPSWRVWDVENEADLVEDFIRSHGLNGVKLELPPLDEEPPVLNDVEIIRVQLDEVLHGNGFYEVIAGSFFSQKDFDLLEKLDPKAGTDLAKVRNAVESNYSYLRNTSILHHAKLACENMKMGVRSFKVYEYTRHFHKEREEGAPYDFERDVLAFSYAGRWFVNEWRQEEPLQQKVQLFKGIVEALGSAMGTVFTVNPGESKLLHPGCQARIMSGRTECGYFGLIHPAVREALEVPADMFYGELDVVRLLKVLEERPYPTPSDFPMIKRDLTLKVPFRVYASRVQSWMKEVKLEFLTDIAILDEFRKQEEDFRRVTYRLSFKSGERTLEHAEIDAQVQKVLEQLKEKYQIELA